MKKNILFILLFSSHLFVLAAQEYTIKTVPNPKTFDAANFVSNPDGILDTYTLAQVNKMLQTLEADTKAEVAVVLLNSIDNNNIEGFAVKLFEEWGIGKKNVDNGLLILFVLDKRTVRFEVGYGLEGVLPDAICKRIQIQTMIPEFKNGNYGAGILAGVERIVSIVHTNSSNEVVLPEPGKQSTGIVWQAILAVCLSVILISWLWIHTMVGKIKNDAKLPTNRARYHSLKTKRKTVNYLTVAIVVAGSLLALLFFHAIYMLYVMVIPLAIIPASLYAKAQMRKLRTQPIRCDVCESMMHILPEDEDNKFLDPSQDFEERIQSVNYDVFLCNNCGNKVVFEYDNKSSNYAKCPKCSAKAFTKKTSYRIQAPTYISAGLQRVVYHCKFCGYEKNYDMSLPRLQHTAGGIGGNSSGGGSHGGSFGGSFGGGRSGGGGSTSSW
ncbi:hypothetical protein EZS27_003969 [termite gut metagenome]|uniref:TPM domain-containing protein n=1 Tax=termite gut metagenome TaxID=433724 RepID=A0A5J4SQN2_9ZZZZ